MLRSFRDPSIDPRHWAPRGEWAPEGERAATGRMPAFTRDFFDRLLAEFPALWGGAVFLRWSVQHDDVYAFFDRPLGFVVQIDPHLEYVVIFGRGTRGEHGDWGNNDRAQDALDHVRSLLGASP